MDYKKKETSENTGEEISFSPSSYGKDAKPIDTTELWRKIISSTDAILASRFSEPQKRDIKSHVDRIAIACPYCGDSYKDPRKKRGNLFSTSWQFHCFNADCDTHRSIFYFLKEHNRIHNFSAEEQSYLNAASKSFFTDVKNIRSFAGLETLCSEEILSLSIPREFIFTKLRLQEIKGSHIEKYLRERLQTKFQNFGWDPVKGVLYVFNLNKVGDRVLGMQIKTFNKKNPYLTYKASGIHKYLGIYKEENHPNLEKLDLISTVFGIFRVDLTRPVSIFEGPLDSFLFPNSLAVCSAKNSLPFELTGIRYFYDNDRTGKEWALKRIQEGTPVFLWKKYIEENKLHEFDRKIKDLNDLLLHVKRANKKFKPFVEYFSTDKYDMIWI